MYRYIDIGLDGESEWFNEREGENEREYLVNIDISLFFYVLK